MQNRIQLGSEQYCSLEAALNGPGSDSTGLKLKLVNQDLSFFAFGNIKQEISESTDSSHIMLICLT